MVLRARVRFLADCIPAPKPLTSWEVYWQFADSRRAATRQEAVPRPAGDNPDMRAYARIDDGRWIADCPWGCGAAFNLPQHATWFWCTECAGGGQGLTAALVWPEQMGAITTNMESLPTMLQFWPCPPCQATMSAGVLCPSCRGIQGAVV